MPRQRGCSPSPSPSTGPACTARWWCAAGATCWAARCGTTPASSAMTGGSWSSATASRAWTRPARRWGRRSGAGSASLATATGSSFVGPCCPRTGRRGWAARCWCSWATVPPWRPCWPARPTRGPGCMRAWRSTTGSSAGVPNANQLEPAVPGRSGAGQAPTMAGTIWRSIGELLEGPGVAVGVLEVGVGDGRLAGGAHVLDLADLDAALQELGPGGVDVVHHQVEGLDRAGGGVDDADPDADRAGRAGRGQLHDPEAVAEALVEVGVEPDLLGVEGLGPVDVADGDGDQLELHSHGRGCPPVG